MAADGRTRIAVAAAAGLALADASIVTLALPRLMTELDASVEGVAAVIGVYTVVVALMLLPAEFVRRVLGGRLLGAASLALFAAASAGCAAAQSLDTLLVLRGVQALGGAGVLVAAFDVLDAGVEHGPGRRLWSTAAVVGVAAGPALGGVLTQAFDWRAIFIAQIPIALAGAAACLATKHRSPSPEHRSPSSVHRSPLLALGLVSAALTAVLFMLVLLLVAGWNLSPLAAAITVSVLPLAALAAARVRGGDPRSRASTGCVLVGAGTISLAFLPTASAWWTIIPQLLAGAGMGLALPALAGELLPERSSGDAARLLTARHAGIALALLVLAPVISSNLDSATFVARERGVALVLDSPLPPEDKLKLAPDLLGDAGTDQPRKTLRAAIDRNRANFTGAERSAYDELGRRADDTLIQAVKDSFRAAFLIAGALALIAAAFVFPGAGRRALLARAAVVALAVGVTYGILDSTIGPKPVQLADPCKPRLLPEAGGITGFIQDAALRGLDAAACQVHASREELVLALADEQDRKRFIEKHGADPVEAGLQSLIGR